MQREHPDTDDFQKIVQQRLRNLRSGSVLLSTEALKDPNFDTTVVLICVHNSEGAYGLVLNRPSHMPLSEIFDGFNAFNQKRKVYIGGPVRQEELQLIHITDTPVEEAYQVADRIHLGGKWDDLESILNSSDESIRMFLGYSGWAPEQLESEIEAGAWEVFNVDLEKLLLGEESHLLTPVDQIQNYLKSLS